MTSYQLWERFFPQEKRWLGLIVGCSLMLHVSVFFIFHIEKLPEGRAIVRPPSIVFISGDTGASRLDGSDPMKWINWRDPAVIALPRAPIPKPLPIDDDRDASFQTLPLPELPEWNPLKMNNLGVAEELKALVQSNMEKSGSLAMPLNVEAPPKLSGSVVVLEGALKDRRVIRRIQMPRPPTKVSLRATEYFVRVLSGGAVVQVKVNRSSGDTAIDQQGLNILKKWCFAPSEGVKEDLWEKVIVFWDFQEDNSDRVEISF